MVEKYNEANETAATPVIEYCPKCAKRHPKMIKARQTKNGKQMYRCTNCNKRFVSDTGQLTFYSHQSLSKWEIVLEDALNGLALSKTAVKIDMHYVTVFRFTIFIFFYGPPYFPRIIKKQHNNHILLCLYITFSRYHSNSISDKKKNYSTNDTSL